MEELLPKRVSFSLKELEELGVIKKVTAVKLINQNKLKAFRIGVKYFILRENIIDFINKNTC
jgi:DNA-binding Lrp family transcriptional regulator